MHKNTVNPLRISQESLDLDDIISDLNSSNDHQSVGQSLAVKGEAAQQQARPKTGNRGKIESVVTTTARTSSKGKKASGVSTSNKENDSLAINRQVQQEAMTVAKSKATTTEALLTTQATTIEKASTSQAEDLSRRAASRYTEDPKSPSALIQEEETDQLRQAQPPAPFYFQKGSSQPNLSMDEDVESFQRKLDTLIVNFRSETLSEFMKTKRQVLSDQTQTIDAERRRCNTLLGVKQNEIEQLKEGLARQTRRCEDLGTRCEGMAFWAGKSKTLLRIKLLQHNAFQGLKQYKEFSKHSKIVLQQKLRHYRESVKRKVFLGWERHYKEWKVVKNKQDFDKAVKLELQHICAQYNKEIESLRERLSEAQATVDSEHRTKAMMQEQLKKAFMRGVCALNFEAMHILNPNDQQMHIEREMEKQVMSAMNSASYSSPFEPHTSNMACPPLIGAPNAPIYKSVSETFTPQSQSSSDLENAYLEKKMTAIDGPQPNPFSQNIAEEPSMLEYKKVESKDSMWKPAPVMGRELSQHVVPSFTYSQPTITSQLRNNTQQQQSVVLSSHFTKLASSVTPQSINTDLFGVMKTLLQPGPLPDQVRVLEEDTHGSNRVLPGNPTVIQNSSTLPDFVSSGAFLPGGHPSHHGEGRTIIANTGLSHNTSGAGKINGKSAVTPSVTVGKKVPPPMASAGIATSGLCREEVRPRRRASEKGDEM